jgi:predicted porin
VIVLSNLLHHEEGCLTIQLWASPDRPSWFFVHRHVAIQKIVCKSGDNRMKKMLFAATALAVIGGSALAQTNVTIYGLLDTGLIRESGGAAGNVTKLSNGGQNGSRLGFKGTEDLGDGRSALFVLESGFDIGTGASQQGSALFGRQAYVGLKDNSLGALTFGRQYTAVNNALAVIDPFGLGLAGASINLMSVGSKSAARGGPGLSRMNNAIKYSAPTLGGFTGEFSYAPGEVVGNNKANRQLDGSISYAAGPVTVTLAHNRVADATATNTAKVTFLGAKYNFGVATLSLAAAVNKGAFSGLADIANPDSRDYLVGVSVPVGAGTILASYIKKKDRSGAANDANLIALGYTYALSKRTNLYTSLARISNTRPNE